MKHTLPGLFKYYFSAGSPIPALRFGDPAGDMQPSGNIRLHSFRAYCKYWIFVCLLVGGLLPVKGQYVTIPDSNFAADLSFYFPQCMNGNQLDTTCQAVLTDTSLNVMGWGIQSLEGIQYFHNLSSLYASGNAITSIPYIASLKYLDASSNELVDMNLSDGLEYLDCNSNDITLDSLPNPLPSHLKVLICYAERNLTKIPPIPDSLLYLDCWFNNISTLPALPATLGFLGCDNNSITVLPSLPAGLNLLSCGSNLLDSLPSLPASLTLLLCSYNHIDSLPALPALLDSLDCSANFIANLPPSLPVNLQWLICGYNYISSLPPLPASLNYLDCSNDSINILPSLPASMQTLICAGNKIHILPTLPPGLLYLDCGANKNLPVLPALPGGLQQFLCSSDSITVLPVLPVTLTNLDFRYNLINSIPPLPPKLVTLSCGWNPVPSIPNLPQSVRSLDCSNTQLSYLPPLPDYMDVLNCSFNPNLTCLPEIKSIQNLSFEYCPITCLPDYGVVRNSNPALNTIPLCDLFNPGGCNVFWNISGRTYFDANNDCVFDSTDEGLRYMKVMLYSAGVLKQQVYGGGEGFYSFKASHGSYTVRIDTSIIPFTLECPATDSINAKVTAGDSLLYANDFVFQCRPGYDLGVASIWNDYHVIPRPGAAIAVNINAGDMSQLYGANCASGVSGQVVVTLSGKVTYKSPAPGALTPTVNGQTLTYNIANFAAINTQQAFNGIYQIADNATENTYVCFNVSVTPTAADYNLSNNTGSYCILVRSSFDPNEKEVYPTSVDSANQWLTYTVRFQNTGTAPAVNIIVRDTLNPNLDPSSFQLLAYSAKNLTQLFGNVVVFNFPNINLVDSASSDSLSRGFVQYRIKTIANLQQNAVITNTASIYFDNNPAIATNTVSDTVAGQQTCTPNDTTINQTICSGDSVLFNGVYYKSTGVYSETLTNAGGCDSVVNLELTVVPVDTQNISQVICRGDSFYFYGTYLSVAGTYDTLLSSGCDTLVNLNLSLQDSILPTQLNDTICRGDSILFNDTYYKYPGSFTAHFNSASGCDSVIHLTLTILDSKSVTLYDTICPGDSVLFGGSYYNQSGNYSLQFGGALGCDTLLTMHLFIDSFIFRCYHYPYYPMLDSINIWNYVPNNLVGILPPHNPGGQVLRGNCSYPLVENEAEFTSGDSIINNVHYLQLWYKTFYADSSSPPCLIGFIREDTAAQKVYFRDILNNPEITLYDYSLVPGSYFVCRQMGYNGVTTNSSFRLDSITMVQITAGTRRKFYFACDTCTNYFSINAFSWVEGTGNLADMLLPYSSASYASWGDFEACSNISNQQPYPYNCSQIMSCFSHNQKVYFDSCAYAEALQGGNVIDSCTYVTGLSVKQITSLNSFTIYPNPASAQITLQFDVSQSDALDITLLDATGRQVLPAMHTGLLAVGTQTRQMNIEGLASGFYLVACKNASGAIYRKLIVRGE